MKDTVKKLDKLSREIIQFVKDENIHSLGWNSFFNEKQRRIFYIYIDGENTELQFRLYPNEIVLTQYSNRISFPIKTTDEELYTSLVELQNDFDQFKNENLERIRLEADKRKAERISALEKQIEELKSK